MQSLLHVWRALIGVVAVALTLPALATETRLPRLVLAGPPAAVSYPLVRMVDTGALADLADSVEFQVWRDPDQLRLMTLEGQADVLAMPTNVAANLYNRGAPVRLVNVSTWGVLWLVSRAPDLKTLGDLKGAEIAMPFRADMPDIVFGVVAEAQGLDARKDFKMRYVASPMDAMQLLIARRVDHALLAEPAVSMALRRTQSFPLGLIAPDLHRSIDLQQEWGRVLGRSARIPQAGITLVGAVGERADVVARVHTAYAEALAWCQRMPEACGEAVAARIPMLDALAVADSIVASPLEAVSAADARTELEFFYQTLAQRNPALIGGAVPDARFYGQAE